MSARGQRAADKGEAMGKAEKRPQRKFPPRFWTKAHCSECAASFYIREKGARCVDRALDVWRCPRCEAGQLELPGVK